MQKIILITGAGGYLGQHLARRLHESGWRVRGFGRRPRPAALPEIEWRQGDVSDLHILQEAMQGCAAAAHLACLPLSASFENPQEDFRVNALGTLNVLLAARAQGVQRVVYTSTAQVYGLGLRLPQRESDLPRPLSPYAASKLCGETLCAAFSQAYHLETVTLRLFNVYGPALDGAPRSTVETLFIRQALQGLPPLIKSNPQEGRDFIHAVDAAQAIALALSAAPAAAGQVINIGSGRMTTLTELAAMAAALAERPLAPVVESTLDRPPLQLRASTRKAARLLGFRPRLALADGLAEIYRLEKRRDLSTRAGQDTINDTVRKG